MKRMSFALTTEQILNQTKTVTRRNGWKNLKPGDLIQPVEKCMGLKKGEQQTLLGAPIEVTNISFEELCEIDNADLIKEGFPNLTRADFINLYKKANNCDGHHIVTRIEFTYTNILKP